MAALALRMDIKIADKTLAAIEAAMVAGADSGLRPHLGASLLGRDCERQLWYSFRWAKRPDHDGRLLRLFARGQREEQVFIDLLRKAGITVVDTDESGQQYSFSAVAGHVGGSMDAACQGLPESAAWHVCEMKTYSAKSFNALIKTGVEQAKPEHWAQMQCYMGWSGMTRALYMAVCKDDDRLHLERIDFNPAAFERLMHKAQRIVTAAEPPPRISDDTDWFQCKWCDYRELCHSTAAPITTCRTCCHATPELDGNARWTCARHQTDLEKEAQHEGCQAHLFIPALLSNWAAVVDASLPGNWVQYEHKDTGRLFKNGLRDECFQSIEIHAVADKQALTDETVQEIRQGFDGRLVA